VGHEMTIEMHLPLLFLAPVAEPEKSEWNP
jgi:hypothetical protein